MYTVNNDNNVNNNVPPTDDYAGDGDLNMNPEMQDNNDIDVNGNQNIDPDYNDNSQGDGYQDDNNVDLDNNQKDTNKPDSGAGTQSSSPRQDVKLTDEQKKIIFLEESVKQANTDRQQLLEMVQKNQDNTQQSNDVASAKQKEQNLRSRMVQFQVPENMSQMTGKEFESALNATTSNIMTVVNDQSNNMFQRIGAAIQGLQNDIAALRVSGGSGQDTVALDKIIKEHNLAGPGRYKTAQLLLGAANNQNPNKQQRPGGGRKRNVNKSRQVYGDFQMGGRSGGHGNQGNSRNISNMSGRDKEQVASEAVLRGLNL